MGATLPIRKPPITEDQIEAVINRGGGTIKEPSIPQDTADVVKHINIRLTEGIIAEINQRREQYPRKPGSPKPGISLHDWIVEAVLAKLKE